MGFDPVSLGLGAASTVGNFVSGGKQSSQQQKDFQAQQQLYQQAINQEQPIINSLANWNGLKAPELSALTNNAAASGQSDVNTLMSRGGGGNCDNALAENLLTQNQMNSERAVSNIGAAAAGQEESALASAGQMTSGLSSLMTGMGGTYGGYGQQIGNPWSSGFSSLGGLGAQLGSSLPGLGGKGSSTPNVGTSGKNNSTGSGFYDGAGSQVAPGMSTPTTMPATGWGGPLTYNPVGGPSGGNPFMDSAGNGP